MDGAARTVTVHWDRLTPAGLPVRVGPGAADALEPVLDRVRRWLGEGIASLVAVLDPGVIVIGGGVAAAGDLLLEPTRSAFSRQLTGRGHRPEPSLTIAQLGNDAGMIGAADLAALRRG